MSCSEAFCSAEQLLAQVGRWSRAARARSRTSWSAGGGDLLGGRLAVLAAVGARGLRGGEGPVGVDRGDQVVARCPAALVPAGDLARSRPGRRR